MLKRFLVVLAGFGLIGSLAFGEPHGMHHHYFKRYYKNRGLERNHRWHHGKHWHNKHRWYKHIHHKHPQPILPH